MKKLGDLITRLEDVLAPRGSASTSSTRSFNNKPGAGHEEARRPDHPPQACRHHGARRAHLRQGASIIDLVQDMKKLGDLITRLKRAGTTGLGEHIFDKELQ